MKLRNYILDANKFCLSVKTPLLDDQIMDDQHLNVASKTKIVFVRVRQPGLVIMNIGSQNNRV